MKVEQRYLNETYLINNPSWDRGDALWKAKNVLLILESHNIQVQSLCEVGCGTGDILVSLANKFQKTKIVGFDISPYLQNFWQKHDNSLNIKFILGEFHSINDEVFDVIMMLDVFEHVRDPFTFLEDARKWGKWFVFHVPLDLSVTTVARGYPLINGRNKSGHIHYYTKDLALATLKDTGYDIVDWRYTGASLNSPHRGLITRLVAPLRRLLYLINHDLAVRVVGGETLIVLARPVEI